MKKITLFLMLLISAVMLSSCGGKKKGVESVTISFPGANNNALQMELGTTFLLNLKITPSDAEVKNIVWNSSNPAVATVSSSGLVTAIAEGTTQVSVVVDGKSATITVKVVSAKVAVTSITLNKSNLSMLVGDTETLVATILTDDATNKNVAWSSSNTSVASVDNKGVITAVAAGSATITATADGKSATCSVEVTAPIIEVTGVSLDPTTLEVSVGDVKKIVATVLPANATDKSLTWASNSTDIATVDTEGNVKGIKEGNVTIQVTTNNGLKATCEVTVTKAETNVLSVTLNKTELELIVGGSETLEATVSPITAEDKTITWSSGDSSIATVDSNGKVVAVAKGSTSITATSNNGKSATCNVTVKEPSGNGEDLVEKDFAKKR